MCCILLPSPSFFLFKLMAWKMRKVIPHFGHTEGSNGRWGAGVGVIPFHVWILNFILTCHNTPTKSTINSPVTMDHIIALDFFILFRSTPVWQINKTVLSKCFSRLTIFKIQPCKDRKISFYTHFAPSHPCAMLTKHFDLTQVCIWLFSNIERGNWGVLALIQ